MKMSINTFKAFIRGMGQSMDMDSTLYRGNTLRNRKSDSQALSSDWKTVGNDLKKAMGEINRGPAR